MTMQKVLIGTLSGLVAGVAIGVLMAPAEGRETRRKIADTAESLKKKLKHLRGMTADELDELKSIFEKETDGLKDDVRHRILDLIKAAKEKGNNHNKSKSNQLKEHSLS